MTIGKFEDLTLEQARKKATELNYIVGLGKDPSLEPEPGITYGQLFSRYIDEYAKEHTATWEEMIKNHRRHFRAFHKREASEITREQVKHWFTNLAKTSGKHAANRNFNTLRAVLTWGLSNGIVLGDNPCTGIRSFKTTARDRFIQPGDEFVRFAAALNAEGNTTIRDFFWICLFMGARCSNVLSMEWNQINMELHQWRHPLQASSLLSL